MNRAKGAALLMLVGSFAAGGGSVYAYKELTNRPAVRNPCQQRSERTYRSTVYDRLSMTPDQRAQWDSLLDLRSRATAEIMAIPRAKDDSMRADIRRKHRALLTPEQLKTLDDGVAEARRRQSERQKLCEQQQSGKNRSNTSKSK